MRFAEKKDMLKIIEIWQESFGDSREDIENFFFQCAENVRVCIYTEEDKVAGFLCLLSATLTLKKVSEEQVLHNPAEYIYAVATKKEFRNKGISTSLLEYVKVILVKEQKCGILVPAEESLEQFYRKRGFSCCFEKAFLQVISSSINPCEKHHKNPPFKGIKDITVSDYSVLREKELHNVSHLRLAEEVVAYAIQSYLLEGATLSSISVGEKEYGFLYRLQGEETDTLFIQETTATSKEEIDTAVRALLMALGRTKAEVCISYPAYGTLLPEGSPYHGSFNLVLD
ncbi:MAG TPA: GNAT family N-acetyltransferase [Lachnospiraceae bacterium]|nr:GNAT family N-acetyltransferase [Lachnospiraceae bacterium]